MAFQYTGGDTDAMTYGDIAALDGLSALSICATVNTATVAADRAIVSKFGSNSGFEFRIIGSPITLGFLTGDGSANATSAANTTIGSSTKYTVGVSWDGTNAQYLLNGAGDGNPAHSDPSAAANALLLNVGNRPSGALSFTGSISNVYIWIVALSLDEMIGFHAGHIPDPANLRFWQPCYSDTMVDLIGQNAATEVGSVVVVEDFGLTQATYPAALGRSMASIVALTSVFNETEDVSRAVNTNIGLQSVFNETEEVSDAWLTQLGIQQVLNETEQTEDGGSSLGHFDPAGFKEEVMAATTTTTETVTESGKTDTIWVKGSDSNSCTWRMVYPPFIARTNWTND